MEKLRGIEIRDLVFLHGHKTGHKMLWSVLAVGAGMPGTAGAAAIIADAFQSTQSDKGIQVPPKMYKQIQSIYYQVSILLWGAILIDHQAMCERFVDIAHSLSIALPLIVIPRGLALLGSEVAKWEASKNWINVYSALSILLPYFQHAACNLTIKIWMYEVYFHYSSIPTFMCDAITIT